MAQGQRHCLFLETSRRPAGAAWPFVRGRQGLGCRWWVVATVLAVAGCHEDLIAIQETGSSAGGQANTCNAQIGDRCDSVNSVCCDNSSCNRGVCTPVDAGTCPQFGNQLGQTCAGDSCCATGNCQTIASVSNLCVNPRYWKQFGDVCTSSNQCASLSCNESGHCAADNPPTPCSVWGTNCNANNDCCSGQCISGKCDNFVATCRVIGDACTSDLDCCTNPPNQRSCVKVGDISRCLASYCRSANDVCAADADCCQGTCTNSRCAPATSVNCTTHGYVCSSDSECCSGRCVKTSNNGSTCAAIDGCQPLSESCFSNTDCCSGGCFDPGLNNGKRCGTTSPLLCLAQGEFCSSGLAAGLSCCTSTGSTACTLETWLDVSRCALQQCQATDERCTHASDCCSHFCAADAAGDSLTCRPSCTQQSGQFCVSNYDCCTGNCWQNICTDIISGGCASLGSHCQSTSQCCEGTCDPMSDRCVLPQ